MLYFYGEVTLPHNGRKINGDIHVIPGSPGNIYEIVEVELYWSDTDEPVTTEEMNKEIVRDKEYTSLYLGEYVIDTIMATGELVNEIEPLR